MIAIIEKYKIECVWHFTDKSNLDSIKEHGLLSFAELEERGIKIPCPGGNDWSHNADKMKGVHKYVHLSFVRNHPMLYLKKMSGEIKDPVNIKIDTRIILVPETCFCTDVSNKNGVDILTSEQAVEKIDFDVLFTYMNWNDSDIHARRKSAEKAEILIPREIPKKYILEYING